ncbi:DEAD/DEAH box helicase family protein [Aurantimonas sp. C2-6-R+9]|uniref:TOTE conflict system archaeo-eukaryotic primase domain-containing protein n=1 Tax=unclassified Aurantimonas TaxID=2638230 RepID=UPI002E17CB91|nr:MULTISPECIES: DEAD/DEAH box helicase family protein [unclassified Aurantimonas]MEC5292820.1 DEAD/DEAH box helicase family protein [Aurantimonas sp. C2-3-R2]MEC5382676.1 DEAD/DEAH box helicase family protein [Aurantimonas sp. C2-6-R+9]MEC5413900.1 DEAD/DEAH box helicase family protein [Aurantimonas sp. C2-4-R8]
MIPDDRDEVARIQTRLVVLEAERAELEASLAKIERRRADALAADLPSAAASTTPTVTTASSAIDKVALFRRLFAGRPDVFPVRWENRKTAKSGYAPACANEWVKGVCGKPQVKCGECPHQAFIPVSDDIIEKHLRGGDSLRPSGGDFVAGVYPLLPDETCWFLVADFDKENWAADALAMVETCRAKGVPAALERSRSGNGGHVWLFFSEPVPARTARQLGAAMLTETMERRPEIGFSSYDRFFPSQDTMPVGGFGNLIALPLQRRARELGNSVFIDQDLRTYDDQWAFLAAMPRLSANAASELVADAEKRGRVLGVRMPVEDEDADEPWRMTPSRRPKAGPISVPLPSKIKIVFADQLYIDRTELPAAMTARLIRLAAFQNPEFYRAQSMRFPTFGKPRIISCAELHARHVGLPRGCLDEAVALIRGEGAEVEVDDLRVIGNPLPSRVRFQGTLYGPQVKAFDALLPHDHGVLAATTAFGKTVVAASLIAQRGRNALVLVHRRELLTQWVERLKTFLDIDPKDIGIIGGGRRKPTGIIDVALIQSLVRQGEVSDLVADYGHLVVDECHHLSAASFELVARRAKARYVLGLSATVARKDGRHPIIFMQCGSIRHRVDARTQAAGRGINHRAKHRSTEFQLPPPLAASDRPSMPAVYAAIAQDEPRNNLIFDDVLKALEAKRSPILLTERRDHLEYLEKRFSRFVRNLVVLRGGMSAGERKAAEAALQVADDQERLILATGRYIGEGFDDQRLDTLFLTMPISWKGTLAQYVGRLHRQHDGKTEVLVVDYVDELVPMLARMAAKRRAGYRALGYTIE